MRSSAVISALSGFALVAAQRNTSTGVTGTLGDAAVIEDNPVGVTYTARLPNRNTSTVRGTVSATADESGRGVVFTVDVTGFTFEGTPEYIYHIHDRPIPSNGNCSGALAHLDPYIRGEQPPCDPSQPQTCQVGDLSGKHGNITTESYSDSYVDLYASTKEGIGAFFGNRSIVFHTANTTRLNCANFTLDDHSATNATHGPSVTTVPEGRNTPAVFTGTAATSFVSFGALLTAVGAAVLLY